MVLISMKCRAPTPPTSPALAAALSLGVLDGPAEQSSWRPPAPARTQRAGWSPANRSAASSSTRTRGGAIRGPVAFAEAALS